MPQSQDGSSSVDLDVDPPGPIMMGDDDDGATSSGAQWSSYELARLQSIEGRGTQQQHDIEEDEHAETMREAMSHRDVEKENARLNIELYEVTRRRNKLETDEIKLKQGKLVLLLILHPQ